MKLCYKLKCIEASTGCLHSALVCVLESTKIQESAVTANDLRVVKVNPIIWVGLQVSAYKVQGNDFRIKNCTYSEDVYTALILIL